MKEEKKEIAVEENEMIVLDEGIDINTDVSRGCCSLQFLPVI